MQKDDENYMESNEAAFTKSIQQNQARSRYGRRIKFGVVGRETSFVYDISEAPIKQENRLGYRNIRFGC